MWPLSRYTFFPVKEIVEPAEILTPFVGTKIENLQPKWIVAQEMQELAPKYCFQRAEIVFVPDTMRHR